MNDAHIRPVDRPAEEPILVSLERLRRCPEEIPDRFWPDGPPRKRGCPRKIFDPKQTLESGSMERNPPSELHHTTASGSAGEDETIQHEHHGDEAETTHENLEEITLKGEVPEGLTPDVKEKSCESKKTIDAKSSETETDKISAPPPPRPTPVNQWAGRLCRGRHRGQSTFKKGEM